MLKIHNTLLSIGVVLFIVFCQGNLQRVAQANIPGSALQQQAQTLTEEGHKQLSQGEANQAIISWEGATKIYQKLHDQEGLTGSLINQSLALRDLGLNLRACNTLLQALNFRVELYGWVCNSSLSQPPEDPLKALASAISQKPLSSVNVEALHELGNILYLIGRLDESQLVLHQTLSQAKRLRPSIDVSSILLSLGNAKQFVFNQLRDKYPDISDPLQKSNNLTLILQTALSCLHTYQDLNASSISEPIRLKAQLNYLTLLLDAENWSATQSKPSTRELIDFHSQIQSQIYSLIITTEQNSSAFSQLPANQSVLARLNFATSLSRLPNKQLHSLAIQYAESALGIAQSLQNQRLKSNSFGVLAKISHNPEQSQTYLGKAVNAAQTVQAWDLAWQWQQQLGELYQHQGQDNKAVEAYKAAIDNLDQVRSNLLSTNSDLRFSFREKIEPIYRNYMQLLLSSTKPDFQEVIAVNDRLQIAELENFLRCEPLGLVSLNEITTSLLPVIYIIDLGERVEVIVHSPGNSFHHHAVNRELVKSNADSLKTNLRDSNFRYINEQEFLRFSQALYNLLIAPEEKYLPQAGTLIFVLDSSFQSLPIAVLHDGKNYLIRRYSSSLTLNSKLQPPKLLRKNQLRALIAGISEKNLSFKDPNILTELGPLPETLTEVQEIKKYMSSSTELLNQEFTTEHFLQKINSSDFPIVHLSTHGEFSSDPKETFILAWNQTLNAHQLNSLLKTRIEGQQNGIELLVLSACETAEGDKRSALGLAGIATQAGARSTIASLWLVNADSTAVLMNEFYKGLRAGRSKAEALQQAQLTLLSNPKYSHPYFWSPFILVGSWL